MLAVLVMAALLVALTVAVHATGLALMLRRAERTHRALPIRPWPVTWVLIRLTWWLIFIHGIEISLWALFYKWQRLLPDLESAFYYSAVTYTTIGYGDVLLQRPWRILGPVEGIVGILMSALSASLFFAAITRLYERGVEPEMGRATGP